MSGPPPLLSVRDLTVSFATDGGTLQAIDGVSFDVAPGETVALVGESGCGKSVTALSILRLVPEPPGSIERGQVLLDGTDLLRLPERDLYAVRGGRIGMVFQEPMSALNPVYTVGAQVAEAVRLHASVSRREARRRAVDLLGRVGLPTPERSADRYPHELSGGMRQRVVIAIAIAAGPSLLIADEPTTALDVVTQAQILALLSELRREREMAVLLVAHDLALVSEIAQRVVVLYAGQVVEVGPTSEVLGRPAHPYTRALLESTVPTGPSAIRKRGTKGRRLPTIEGTVPDLFAPPPGCRFADRCPSVFEPCHTEPPPLFAVGERVVARCHLHAAALAGSQVS